MERAGCRKGEKVYTREAYIRDSCIRPLEEPRGKITEAQRYGRLMEGV